jgi:Domain of unknown function (DUF1902)
MNTDYHVQADWDEEARVWVSTSNIPGLVVEAETLPEFVELVQALAPDLLADNLGLHGDVQIELKQAGLPKAF